MSNTSRINANDHGGKLVLAIALMLAYTIIVYATRLQIKWPWRSGTFKREDYFLLGAIALSIGYSAAVAVAVQHGMGKHIAVLSDQQKHSIRKALLASILLARITESLSLVSLASFIKTMSASVFHKRLVVCAYATIAAWTCAALVVEGIEVAAANIRPAAFIAVGAIAAAILATLFAILTHMIWSTTMRRHRKVFATLWLVMIPCVAAFIIARVVIVPSPPLHGDFTFSGIRFYVWLTIEVNFCIMSAAYVSFMRFAKNATTGFMGQILPPELTTITGTSIISPPKADSSLRPAVRDTENLDTEASSERGLILIQKTVTIEHVDAEHVD